MNTTTFLQPADAKPLPRPSLQQTIDELRNLPAWSYHLQEIVAMIDNDELDASELASKIAYEQPILARMLRVANSPFYGVSGNVSNPLQAINVIGLSNTRSIVMAAVIMSRLPQELEGFDLHEFWQDAITVATAAQLLAKKLSVPATTAFTAGMLHDIGEVILAYQFRQEYLSLRATPPLSDCALDQLEQQTFGFDHAEIGAALAKKWHFPDTLVDSLRWHHDPQKSESTYALILWIADQIAQFIKSDNLDLNALNAIIEHTPLRKKLKEKDWQTLISTTRQQVAAFGF